MLKYSILKIRGIKVVVVGIVVGNISSCSGGDRSHFILASIFLSLRYNYSHVFPLYLISSLSVSLLSLISNSNNSSNVVPRTATQHCNQAKQCGSML